MHGKEFMYFRISGIPSKRLYVFRTDVSYLFLVSNLKYNVWFARNTKFTELVDVKLVIGSGFAKFLREEKL